MPQPAKGCGRVAFHCDVTSVCTYVSICLCHINNKSLTNVRVYIQIYIDIYIHVSLGAHYLGTIYARRLKFGLLLTQT